MSFRTRVVFLFVLASAGCGLTDYTVEIANEKALVDYWDKEDKLLSKPIDMPVLAAKDNGTKKETPKWEVFLRLPQGFDPAPLTIKGKEEALLLGNILAQYGSFSNKIGLQNAYLAVGDDKTDFDKKVYEAFGFLPRDDDKEVTIHRSPTLVKGSGKSVNQDLTIKQGLRPIDQAPTYSFNFYKRDAVQVAIVFQMDKGKEIRSADESIKLSLATLGVGYDQTGVLNDVYKKRNKPLRKKGARS
jgi:hypothetical protein